VVTSRTTRSIPAVRLLSDSARRHLWRQQSDHVIGANHPIEQRRNRCGGFRGTVEADVPLVEEHDKDARLRWRLGFCGAGWPSRLRRAPLPRGTNQPKRFDRLRALVFEDLNVARLEVGDGRTVLRKVGVDRYQVRAGAESGPRLLRLHGGDGRHHGTHREPEEHIHDHITPGFSRGVANPAMESGESRN
jgi:hypothetical protein